MDWKQLQPKFGQAAWWNPPYPAQLYELLERWITPGSKALDLGTGCGVLAREFAVRGMIVLGIDHDELMLKQAGPTEGVDYLSIAAEQIHTLRETYNLITAAQCWHWFDGPNVAQQARTLLAADGILAVIHFDWVDSPESYVGPTEKLIAEFNTKWQPLRTHGIYPDALAHLMHSGFKRIVSSSSDHLVHYEPARWISRASCCAPVSELLPERRAEFSAALSDLLARHNWHGEVVHRLFVAIGQS